MAFTKEGVGPAMILLHGWGCDRSIFLGVARFLRERFTVYSLDLNGFGESSEPDTVWGVKEYSAALGRFCSNQNIVNPIILGHSFGGQIGTYYAAHNPVSNLILVGSAGLRPRKSLFIITKISLFKIVKNILALPILCAYKNEIISAWVLKYGSGDYRGASPMMKRILSRTLSQDLTKEMKKTACPTLLIWGRLDTATPLRNGMRMNRLISKSQILIFEKSGHSPFLDAPIQFNEVITNYLKTTYVS